MFRNIFIKKDGQKDAVPEQKQTAAALDDDELESVTGGTGANYSYWFSSENTDTAHCINGENHNWVKSPGGNFEYCSKCHAERYNFKN